MRPGLVTDKTLYDVARISGAMMLLCTYIRLWDWAVTNYYSFDNIVATQKELLNTIAPYSLAFWFGIFLFLMAIVRMVMTMLPINNWNASFPEQPWSTYRNIPLMIQGLGVAYLILRDAIKEKDKVFTQIGCMILVSYTFFIPVILFVQQIPLIGMLMIPKTLAYVAIAVIAYKNLFKTESI